jgi:hypothetical protein
MGLVFYDDVGPRVRVSHVRHHRRHDQSAGLLTDSLTAGLVAEASSHASSNLTENSNSGFFVDAWSGFFFLYQSHAAHDFFVLLFLQLLHH